MGFHSVKLGQGGLKTLKNREGKNMSVQPLTHSQGLCAHRSPESLYLNKSLSIQIFHDGTIFFIHIND